MLLFLNDNHRCLLLLSSRFVQFSPEAADWEADLPQSSMEEAEAVEYTPVVQNTSEAAQQALLDFYDVMDIRALSSKQARRYERKVFNLLSDHFLDEIDVQEINQMVDQIKDRINKWREIVNKLDQQGSTDDYDTKQLVREHCYNWKTGKIDFRGSRELESKVSLPNIFDGKYLKIKINESRRSAKARGIPENALKDGDYYLLKKVGENYVYETPDDLNIRAVVQQGDVVSEATPMKSAERAVADINDEYKGEMDETFQSLSSYERVIGKQLFTIKPAGLSEIADIESGVPFTLEESGNFGSISYRPTEINPAENLIRTNLRELATYLTEVFSKNIVSLRRLGIKNGVNNLSPAEAQKFVQFLMRSKLKNRASANPNERAADKMSITEIFNSKVPIVCRNSAQIFEGCIQALKLVNSGKLDCMHVTTVSAAYYEGEAGSVGQPNDHAWNVVYVKGSENEIGTAVVDEFQVAAGNKADRTFERSLFTEMNDTKNPQDLVDNFAIRISDFIAKVDSEGGSAVTRDVWKTLYSKYTSLINLEGVDTNFLEQQMDTLRTVLEDNSNAERARALAKAQGVRYCMKMGQSEQPLFLNEGTWRNEISKIKNGTRDLLGLYRIATETVEGAESILANWNLTKEKIVSTVKNLWNKIASVAPDLFGDNEDYKYVYNKFSKIRSLKKPEIKYASRVTATEEEAKV